MSLTRHPYKREIGGRSMATGSAGMVAVLQCRTCPENLAIPFRTVGDADWMDGKFKQKGWALDPAVCPACQLKKKEERKMTAVPNASAVKAQAKMFNLLTEHFDPDAGA